MSFLKAANAKHRTSFYIKKIFYQITLEKCLSTDLSELNLHNKPSYKNIEEPEDPS